MTLARSQFFRTVPSKEPKVRVRKCCTCRAIFAPRSMTHKACGPECAQAHAEKERARKDRKERQEGLQKLKTRTDYMPAAQKAVNRYVNLRDRAKPCVSCGKPAELGGVRNASHFKSVGSNSGLRFHLWNIHTSCYRCNVELSGNLGEYYPRLIERIGVEKVEFLRNAKRERRYEIDELQRIARIFNKKAKRLERASQC
jgi:hypothetical protein